MNYKNLAEVQNLIVNEYTGIVSPISAKANGFPTWFIPFSSWTLWWVVEHRTSEKYITDMASFSNKKFKCNLNESDSSDNETEALFPRFIIIESNSAPITNLLPFIIEKVISTNLISITVKKLKNQTLLIEVEKRKHADFLLKMTKFHNISVKTYPHKSLNVSKGVVRSKELSLCTIEEIKRKLKKQGVTKVKIISIKKEGKTIETNTYIMNFNTQKISEKIKVGYTMESLEQYIPNPLLCYKCQKYGYHEDNCRGHEVYGKILTTTLMTVNSHVNVPIMAVIIWCMQDLVKVGGKRRKY